MTESKESKEAYDRNVKRGKEKFNTNHPYVETKNLKPVLKKAGIKD